jgi:hypothetical protein
MQGWAAPESTLREAHCGEPFLGSGIIGEQANNLD